MNESNEFHRWWHQAHKAEQHIVFPDGCQDVLIIRSLNEPVQVILTEFDFQPRIADLLPGTEIVGFRLRPGTLVSAHVLEAVLENTDQVETILSEECGHWSDLDEAIVKLTEPGATVESTSRQIGVSIRTMQRYFFAQNLPPPDYWRLLARARRAAGLLSSTAALAAIADECNFSDQAHMTRELMRWFGFTPTQLRKRGSILEELRQPALGNWTGEQISTR